MTNQEKAKAIFSRLADHQSKTRDNDSDKEEADRRYDERMNEYFSRELEAIAN